MHDPPIFCIETAIKLLYWCGFVYEHDEVSSATLEEALDNRMLAQDLMHGLSIVCVETAISVLY